MISPELIIILLNLSILSFSYFWFFPRVADSDAIKLSKYDLLSSILSICISAFFFYDKNLIFDALYIDLNWFWFTIITFTSFEMPFALWYYKKHNILDSFK